MDSKVLISMRELSQILATTAISISTSQEEKLLIAVESLSTSPKMEDKPKFQELQRIFFAKLQKNPTHWGLYLKESDLESKSS